MRMLRSIVYMLAALSVVTVIVLFIRSDVEPQTWTPAPLPAMSGEFLPPESSGFEVNRLTRMPSLGPEDVARDGLGRYYTGLGDGSIIRFTDTQGQLPEVIANTGGRPLGLQFDASGSLIIADAIKGLMKLWPDGKLEVLVDEFNGKPMRLVDDLDIASDGTIWFSDASQRFGLEVFMKDFLEASFTGRLLSYAPSTKTTAVHMDGLFFANGVALGPDEEFVLVNETGTGRIHRLWLKTGRAGQQDVFHEGLPGHPDNLSFNGTDTFWVALPGLRDAAKERTSNSLFVRKLLGGLPIAALTVRSTAGFVVGLDTDGAVTHVLFEDPVAVSSITSVNQFGDRLLLGSLTAQHVMSVPVPVP